MSVGLFAVLYPKEGKADRVVELLDGMAKHVKANEPDTLKYEINKENEKGEVIMIESYKNKAALDAHAGSSEFKAFVKQLEAEDLMAKPMDLKFLTTVGGFSSRI